MNRVFLMFYCLMLLASVVSFLVKRKRMPVEQQAIIFLLYGFTIVFFVVLQFQETELLHISRFLNILSPRIKMWVEQLL